MSAKAVNMESWLSSDFEHKTSICITYFVIRFKGSSFDMNAFKLDYWFLCSIYYFFFKAVILTKFKHKFIYVFCS